MPRRVVRRVRVELALFVLACAIGGGCGGGAGVFRPEYEYEEELYLSLDGSATLNVNASVASLVVLRGAEFDPDPLARIDRDEVRRFFGAPDARVSLSLSRRDGRRFVHARLDVDDVRGLSRLRPSSWSDYRFGRRGDTMEFQQTVGSPARGGHDQLKWTGDELVVFRMHLPSQIVFHNAPSGEIERGNILEWEQPLAARLHGTPIEIRVRLEPTSILARTMLLFGATAAAAIATLVGVVWWISRRGRGV